jgi:hypothetical protein
LENLEDKKRLTSVATQADVRLVIVDSLSGAYRGDENDARIVGVIRWLAALARDTRVIWALNAPTPIAPDRRLSVIKNNLGAFPSPIGMDITEAGLSFSPAPEAAGRETQEDKACDLLLTLLRDGAILSTDVKRAADEAVISWSTVKKAQKKLCIAPKKRGDRWFWSLPGRGE